MITYEFLSVTDLLLVKFFGDIETNVFTDFLEFIYRKLENEPLRKVALDFRDARLKLSIESIELIKEMRLRFSHSIHNLHTIHLVREVNETMYSILYASEIPVQVSRIEVCSTIESLINLLDLKISKVVLEEKFKNLKFTFNTIS